VRSKLAAKPKDLSKSSVTLSPQLLLSLGVTRQGGGGQNSVKLSNRS